jgi:hypothetical protein
MTEPDATPETDGPELIEPADVVAARSVSGPAAVPVGPQRCVALLRGITSADADQRIGAAEGPGDLRRRGSLDAREGRTLAWVLAWAAVVETGWYPEPATGLRSRLTRSRVPGDRWPVRRGFLYSLFELAADGWAPAAALHRVAAAISPDGLDPSEAGRYERLVTALSWPVLEPPPDDRPNLPGARAGEPVGPQAGLDMVRGVVSRDPAQRRVWAQTIEWAVGGGRLDDDEASTLGVILAWAVRIERAAAVRAALLAALCAVAVRDRVPPWALDEVVGERDADLDAAGQRLRDTLATALAEHRRRIPDPPT